MERMGLFFLVLAAALSASAPAQALGPVDVEVGAKVGAGTNPVGGGFPNPLGFGVGGRAGVSIFGLYAGLSAMNYFGGGSQQVDVTQGFAYERGSVSPHSFLWGGEAGYGVSLFGLVTLRAMFGIGEDVLGMSGGLATGLTNDNMVHPTLPVQSTSYVYLEPGLTALANLGVFYVGLDASALLLPAGPGWPPNLATVPLHGAFSSTHQLDTAIAVLAEVGFRF
jgi:hypothetical protein